MRRPATRAGHGNHRATDALKLRPNAFDPGLPGIDFTSLNLAA